MNRITALWRGDLPLGDAFWTWAVLGGLIVNVATSLAFLALIAADMAWPALIIGYGCSVPYNILVLVGVWRAAARHPGPAVQADLARGASALLLTALSLT